MPRRAATDQDALDALLRANESVVTHADLRAIGVPLSTITYRIRPRGGQWQRILPGVVITHRGTPTHRERCLAAIRYAGPGAIVTAAEALRMQGVRGLSRPAGVVVLVPHESHRSSHGFVTVRRTSRDVPAGLAQGIFVASCARALVDECRERTTVDGVRELVAAVVQPGHCSVSDVAREVFAAARQRTALPRLVLDEISAGVRSVAEAKARELFRAGGVPQPRWNAQVCTLEGDVVAEPDGIWEDVMAALELDSMAWHLSPGRYLHTQRRQRRLITAGIPVLPVGPGDIIDNPTAFLREVVEFRREAANRILPTHLAVVPRGVAA